MLFDLRSPRRRAAVKVIYGTLAVLMGGGLIFFGIGSDATGGLADLFNGGGGSGSTFDDQIDDAESKVEENPKNQAALLELVTLNLQAGNQQAEGIDQNTGYPILGTDSENSYNDAADAWARYLKLNPKQPDPNAALQLANAYFVLAVNGDTAADAQIALENAAEAQRIAADGNPIVGNLRSLATYLYFAGKTAEADQVAEEVIAKSPPKQQAALRKQFDALKKQAASFQKQVEAESKAGAQTGGNPLDESGGIGGSSLGGGSLSSP